MRRDDYRKWQVRMFLLETLCVPLAVLLISIAAWGASAIAFADAFKAKDGLEGADRHLGMVAAISLGSGVFLSLRSGVAAGAAAMFTSALLAAPLPLVSAFSTHRGAVPGGGAAGLALGSAAAATVIFRRRIPVGKRKRPQPRPGATEAWIVAPFLGVLVALLIARLVGKLSADPGVWERAWLGLIFGAVVGAPFAALATWLLHRQKRRRYWRDSLPFGFGLLIAVIVLSCGLAAAVPFGEPKQIADGVSVGLLIAATGSAMLMFGEQVLERWLPAYCSAVASLALALVAATGVLVAVQRVQVTAGILAAASGMLLGAAAITGVRLCSRYSRAPSA